MSSRHYHYSHNKPVYKPLEIETGNKLIDTTWSPWTSAWIGFFVTAIVVGIVFLIFYLKGLFWWAPTVVPSSPPDPITLLQVDFTEVCIGNDIDRGPQNLQLTYYNTYWCTTQCAYYFPPELRGYGLSTSIYGCPGLLSTVAGWTYGNQFPGLIYSSDSLPLVSIQDVKKSFSVSFWFKVPVWSNPYSGTTLGIICGFNLPHVPEYYQFNFYDPSMYNMTWSIRLKDYNLYWHISPVLFLDEDFYPNTKFPTDLTPNIGYHIIFQWDSSVDIGYFYLNGELQTQYHPPDPYIDQFKNWDPTTYFATGCGFTYIGEISYLRIYNTLPSIDSLYDSSLQCDGYNASAPVGEPPPCPVPTSNISPPLDSENENRSSSSSTGG